MREAPAGEGRAGRTQAPTGTPAPGGPGLPALAGGSPELDVGPPPPQEPTPAAGSQEPRAELVTRTQPEVAFVAILAGAASIFFGIIPQPLFDLVNHAGSALSGLF
jgi:hypothetical protein